MAEARSELSRHYLDELSAQSARVSGDQLPIGSDDRGRTLIAMTGEPTFVAVLRHDPERARDRVLELPVLNQGSPPTRVRVPTTFAGAAAWDVYELIGSAGWPARVEYRHVGVEPSTEQYGR